MECLGKRLVQSTSRAEGQRRLLMCLTASLLDGVLQEMGYEMMNPTSLRNDEPMVANGNALVVDLRHNHEGRKRQSARHRPSLPTQTSDAHPVWRDTFSDRKMNRHEAMISCARTTGQLCR